MPAIPFLRRVAQPTSPRQNQGLGHSASQGRFFALILASLFHASYFAIMGSKRGFSTSLVGYAIAAFARAILTGKYIAIPCIQGRRLLNARILSATL